MKEIQKRSHITMLKRTIFKIVVLAIMPFLVLEYIFKKIILKSKKINLGLLNIEFFHKEAKGFGGYGKTAKNLSDYFNSNGSTLNIEVILTRCSKKPQFRCLHNAKVAMAPDADSSNIPYIIRYARMLNKRNFNLLVTVEYCTDYQYALFLLPKTPLVIWIHDPRPKECLKKIATVNLEILAVGKTNPEELIIHERNIQDSIAKVIRLSNLINRKVIFATTAYSLIERAKQLYGMFDINPIILPHSIDMPKLDSITYSSRPSVCFLARLDPQKRPWLFFELAKRFKNVDFLVAGKTHFPKIMDPIISKYSSVPNLKFLGFVDGEKKDEMLKNVWALVNTSIHEGLPVSFLESFAYGKPIISCQNPDNFAERFGIYTGEVLGDGYDTHTIDIFAHAMENFLSNDNERIEKGLAAREFVSKNYSFQKFEEIIQKIIQDVC